MNSFKSYFSVLVLGVLAALASADRGRMVRLASPSSVTFQRCTTRSTNTLRRPSLVAPSCPGPSAVVPLAFAIPGNGIPEQVFVGGTLNFLNIYNALVTGRVLLSWFPQAQGIAALRPLYTVTDPFLNLFRGLGLNFAGLDFSILPAFFLLQATTNAFVALGAEIPKELQSHPPSHVEPRLQPSRRRNVANLMP